MSPEFFSFYYSLFILEPLCGCSLLSFPIAKWGTKKQHFKHGFSGQILSSGGVSAGQSGEDFTIALMGPSFKHQEIYILSWAGLSPERNSPVSCPGDANPAGSVLRVEWMNGVGVWWRENLPFHYVDIILIPLCLAFPLRYVWWDWADTSWASSPENKPPVFY